MTRGRGGEGKERGRAVQVGQCGKLANRIGNGARQVVFEQISACPTSKQTRHTAYENTRRGEKNERAKGLLWGNGEVGMREEGGD